VQVTGGESIVRIGGCTELKTEIVKEEISTQKAVF
jgi:hypothetical protein